MFLVSLLFAVLQFTPAFDRSVDTLMKGHWQSCPEGDTFTEVGQSYVHEGMTGKIPWFEIHLGPKDEFAIFAGTLTKADLEHSSKRNLLAGYKYGDLETAFGGRTWDLPNLGVRLNVIQLPSPDALPSAENQQQCLSYLVLLKKTQIPQKARR